MNMEKSELVIELGVEEIPASMIEDATRQLAEIIRESLRAHRLTAGKCTQWYTPRRIIVGFQNVPARQEDLVETVTGPPKRVAYDSEGNPGKAAIAFAKKNGIPLSKIRIVHTAKGEYLTITRKVRGERTHKLLESLIPGSVAKIQFPKTMHWTPDGFHFVRPLRWIVALFDGKTVRFRLAGIVSSKQTRGHRFLGKAKIAVSSLQSLKERLRDNSVIVDPEERLSRIKSGLEREAEACGGRLLEDPDLLKTVVNLNEAPSIVRGSFERRFLSLPKEILITVMREHQKYFSIVKNDGQLQPAFLAVVNVDSDPGHIIRAGHERVLRARLADASFFWDTDRKTKLRDREQTLKNVLFQEKLGSYFEKGRRVLALLPRLTAALEQPGLLADLETAAHLFKCDLVTEMVKEFSDLQGIVGGLYAREERYPAPVWQAVYEQYRPKSTAAPSPSSATGAILALADRLDSVCGCFSVGLIPSGSGDPFAVRRQGNGILKIVFDHRLSLSLKQVIQWSLETHGRASIELSRELEEFFEGRLRFLFEEMGFSYDCIHAVLAAGTDNPMDTLQRLSALEELRQESDFLSLASNFKRIANILSQAENVNFSPDAGNRPDESALKDPAEQALWRSYLRVEPEVRAAQGNHDYGSALRSLASMRSAVDEFFGEVMVMAEDPAVRSNRISLLNCISQLFFGIADISKIVIERT
jgi:glycyl-tRNA synthetase beta chain